MATTVAEIAPDTYRISTFQPDFGIGFNQFLVADDEPFLMHTGFRRMFPDTLAAVATVIDPALLRWIGFSHFEADECGALNEWLAAAPEARPVCGLVGAMVNLADYADREARALADGDVLVTGARRLRYLATPHVPHGWDAGLFFEETAATLFCSDLLFQPGDGAPVTEADVVGPAEAAMRASLGGPLAGDMPWTPATEATLARLAGLAPDTLACMHGSSFRGDGAAALSDYAAAARTVLAPAP